MAFKNNGPGGCCCVSCKQNLDFYWTMGSSSEIDCWTNFGMTHDPNAGTIYSEGFNDQLRYIYRERVDGGPSLCIPFTPQVGSRFRYSFNVDLNSAVHTKRRATRLRAYLTDDSGVTSSQQIRIDMMVKYRDGISGFQWYVDESFSNVYVTSLITDAAINLLETEIEFISSTQYTRRTFYNSSEFSNDTFSFNSGVTPDTYTSTELALWGPPPGLEPFVTEYSSAVHDLTVTGTRI